MIEKITKKMQSNQARRDGNRRRQGRSNQSIQLEELSLLKSQARQRDITVQDPNIGLGKGYLNPKPFCPVQPISMKIRFLIGPAAIASYTFTAQDMLKLVVFSTAVNTVYSLALSARLKYIEIWEPYDAAAPGTTGSAGFIWYGVAGTNTGINRPVFTTAASQAYPGHLITKPNKLSVESFWQRNGSSVTFGDFRGLNVGSTVDICFDYIPVYDFASTAGASFVGVAASAGLAGIHPMTANFQGIGLNNM
jgi:hypothetical protein